MPALIHFVDISTFSKKDENKIRYKENRRPDDRSSKSFGFMFKVHKRPGDIIRFIDSKQDKYPVK